jgi:hypothetical protein
VAMLINGLVVLRSEFDLVNPHRDRTSDGWIGDDRHALRASDHNADATGLVHAIDVDKDGVPMAKIVAFLVARCRSGHENRLQYVIFRRVIWSRSWGWTARRYLGVNPHTHHAHFSARHADVAGDSRSWGVASTFGPNSATPPAARPKPRVTPAVAGDHRPGSRLLESRKPPVTGSDVRYVQQWIGKAHCGPPDGTYGPNTADGVRWYQRMRGLGVDGVVGPQTWRSMGVRWSGP